MKLLMLALCAFTPQLAHAEDVAGSPLRQLFTFMSYEKPYSTNDLEEFSAENNIQLAWSQDSIQFCYEAGRKVEAAALLESLEKNYGTVTSEENDPVIYARFGYNYAWTEFEFEKKIPECSPKWMKQTLKKK